LFGGGTLGGFGRAHGSRGDKGHQCVKSV
jgi:hypothetical protein